MNPTLDGVNSISPEYHGEMVGWSAQPRPVRKATGKPSITTQQAPSDTILMRAPGPSHHAHKEKDLFAAREKLKLTRSKVAGVVEAGGNSCAVACGMRFRQSE